MFIKFIVTMIIITGILMLNNLRVTTIHKYLLEKALLLKEKICKRKVSIPAEITGTKEYYVIHGILDGEEFKLISDKNIPHSDFIDVYFNPKTSEYSLHKSIKAKIKKTVELIEVETRYLHKIKSLYNKYEYDSDKYFGEGMVLFLRDPFEDTVEITSWSEHDYMSEEEFFELVDLKLEKYFNGILTFKDLEKRSKANVLSNIKRDLTIALIISATLIMFFFGGGK